MEQALKEKLENVVKLVNNLMVDPDIDIEYYITDVPATSNSRDVANVPYILVKYAEDKYVERKIRLTDRYMAKSAEEIANLVTFSIEQFKEEVDSIPMA